MVPKLIPLLILAIEASAEIYAVHFAGVLRKIEMITVFSDLCIESGDKGFAKFECGLSEGTVVLGYYKDSECTTDEATVKSLAMDVSNWATNDEVYVVDNHKKHVELYCNKDELEASHKYFEWAHQNVDGIVLKYYHDDADSCSDTVTVAQYVRRRSCKPQTNIINY
jgi:hypothetical protein